MDEFLLRLAKDFGFPALVAAYVLIRLDRRLAHVETCLVRICAILSATTGVRVEDPEGPSLDEPSTPEPVSRGDGIAAGDGAATAGLKGDAVAKKGG
ncbi:MAG: hypothetical protein HY720_15495 [Planctomycetes bacterium]|nr:hypothetical protein [Planctomycetota bacterium]